MLKLTNTYSGKEEEFKPIKQGHVGMYVCGVTPYDKTHVGHGRCYVAFDLLYRLLSFLGYKVTYCRNFTDVDDKLLNKAKQEFGDRSRYKEIAEKFINLYKQNMLDLNCKTPDYQPKVTENIPEIIDFVQGLIDAEKAYAVDGNVYFSVESFSEYGKLSKHKTEDLQVGARVKVDQKKRNPLDFALWKSEKEGTFWKSPWGYGRPGWHIECSAMALKYLGEQIDIHGGGRDLIFPHHENEVAQSEGLLGREFVRYWVHNGFIRLKDEKMSKSLGNVFFLSDLFKEYDPILLRFYFFSHQYRAPVDFSLNDIESLAKSYNRLVRVLGPYAKSVVDKDTMLKSETVKKMLEFLLDDLNTPGAFGVLFESLDSLEKDEMKAQSVATFLVDVIGLPLQQLKEKVVKITPEIQKLIDDREQARNDKNWSLADEMRDKLVAMGVKIQDKKL
ncbi:cysteine--tRNA ligase [bacterium]|nr:cysteine--tRNA ligase [bacterium]